MVAVVVRQRLKNRRSILSQGDERWKDVVQELEKELGSVLPVIIIAAVVLEQLDSVVEKLHNLALSHYVMYYHKTTISAS